METKVEIVKTQQSEQLVDAQTEMQQVEIAVAGHVCLDVIPTFQPRQNEGLPTFRPGTLTKVGPALCSTGGAVSNTGLALHRLGVPVRLIGKIGEDLFGDEVLRLFAEQSPQLTTGMARTAGEITSYTVVINPPGVDRSFFHCPGANDTFVAADVQDRQFADARLLHFGYPPLMENIFKNDGLELVELFRRVKNLDLTTSLDLCMIDPDSEAGKLDWRPFLNHVLPFTDVFCPSVDELLFMLDRETYDRCDQDGGFTPARHLQLEKLEELAEECLQAGAAIVLLKLGDQGLYLKTTHDRLRLEKLGKGQPVVVENWIARSLYQPCYLANVVGTTGSGDCTIAGFLSAFLKNQSPEDAINWAVAVGGASVEAADAVSGVPDWSVLQARIQSGWQITSGLSSQFLEET